MPRSLFIPTIGTVLVLAEDWSFTLHEEHRNRKFATEGMKLKYRRESLWSFNEKTPPRADVVVIPKGTHLKVDRIYIRKGGPDMQEFDSVTFACNIHLKGAKAKGALKGRFWAKLPDVNKIVFE